MSFQPVQGFLGGIHGTTSTVCNNLTTTQVNYTTTILADGSYSVITNTTLSNLINSGGGINNFYFAFGWFPLVKQPPTVGNSRVVDMRIGASTPVYGRNGQECVNSLVTSKDPQSCCFDIITMTSSGVTLDNAVFQNSGVGSYPVITTAFSGLVYLGS